jgi:hypothetical protein
VNLGYRTMVLRKKADMVGSLRPSETAGHPAESAGGREAVIGDVSPMSKRNLWRQKLLAEFQSRKGPTFREVVVRYFEPVRRHPVVIGGLCAILAVCIYLYNVRNEVMGLRIQDARIMRPLGIELSDEAGPCSVEMVKRLEGIVRRYVAHMSDRHVTFVARALCGYNPQERLQPAFDHLQAAADAAAQGNEDAAKTSIQEAGKQIISFCGDSEPTPRSSPVGEVPENLKKEFLQGLDSALLISYQRADELHLNRTFDNARAACMADRETILALFLTRLAFEEGREARIFAEYVKQVRQDMLYIAAQEEEKGNAANVARVRHYANSENRRGVVLQAMIDDKPYDEICRLMRDMVNEPPVTISQPNNK